MQWNFLFFYLLFKYQLLLSLLHTSFVHNVLPSVWWLWHFKLSPHRYSCSVQCGTDSDSSCWESCSFAYSPYQLNTYKIILDEFGEKQQAEWGAAVHRHKWEDDPYTTIVKQRVSNRWYQVHVDTINSDYLNWFHAFPGLICCDLAIWSHISWNFSYHCSFY